MRRMPEFAEGLPRTRSAIAYARRMHEGQRREVDGAPFIEHPLEVASLLYYAGAPDHVIAAGVLHDTLEKTAATEDSLAGRFGSEITAIVRAVSEDQRIAAYAERKKALRNQVENAGQDALIVFAADKLSKIRELRHATGHQTKVRRKLRHYSACVELLQRRLPEFSLVTAAQRELDFLPAQIRRSRQLSQVG
jgi:(p)ppGpp synthase/HD superfamily hydrolase